MTSDAARADVMKTIAIAMVMRSLMRHRPARTPGCDAEVELVERSSRPRSGARIVSSTAAIRGAIVPSGRGKPSGSRVTFWRRLCVGSMRRRGPQRGRVPKFLLRVEYRLPGGREEAVLKLSGHPGMNAGAVQASGARSPPIGGLLGTRAFRRANQLLR